MAAWLAENIINLVLVVVLASRPCRRSIITPYKQLKQVSSSPVASLPLLARSSTMNGKAL